MAGEDEEATIPVRWTKKPVWQRFIILSSGSMNESAARHSFNVRARHNNADALSTTILRFAEEGALSEASGLQVGDRILKVGDAKVHTSYELVYEIMRNGIEPLDITVRRAGETVVVQDVIFPTIIEGGVVFGEAGLYRCRRAKDTSHSYPPCVLPISTATVKLIWESLFDF